MRVSRKLAGVGFAALLPSFALAGGVPTLQAYAVDYQLDLFSNFTYATDTVNGDQFAQFDDRRVYGGQVTWARPVEMMGLSHELDLGFELRRGDIGTVGLYKTVARERIGTTREDSVTQSSYSAYSSLKTHWSEHVRTEVGVRADYFDSRDNDITYLYESQLPGEAQPVSDIHFHPVEPRTFRVTLRATF